jgi:putative endonuclease
MTAARRALGSFGEDKAAAWYEANGYRVLARNWRCRDGELDIVARRGPTVVFCEVKTRASAAYGIPAEAVTFAKQRKLRALALLWLRASGVRGGELRFDVACVLGGKLEVIEGAF